MSQLHNVMYVPVHSAPTIRTPPEVFGKSNDGLQDAVRRREIALELKRLAFGPIEEGNQVHNSAFCSEALRRINLPSRRFLAFVAAIREQSNRRIPKGLHW